MEQWDGKRQVTQGRGDISDGPEDAAATACRKCPVAFSVLCQHPASPGCPLGNEHQNRLMIATWTLEVYNQISRRLKKGT